MHETFSEKSPSTVVSLSKIDQKQSGKVEAKLQQDSSINERNVNKEKPKIHIEMNLIGNT